MGHFSVETSILTGQLSAEINMPHTGTSPDHKRDGTSLMAKHTSSMVRDNRHENAYLFGAI
jgi:hypothetical protein